MGLYSVETQIAEHEIGLEEGSRKCDGRSTAPFVEGGMWRILGRLDRRSLRRGSIFVAGADIGGQSSTFGAESWDRGTQRRGKGPSLCAAGCRRFGALSWSERKRSPPPQGEILSDYSHLKSSSLHTSVPDDYYAGGPDLAASAAI